jgi:DNA-binding PadR family transcriptional regulator
MRPPSSPLALTVLALLREEPMHPYRMQRLIEERGKKDVVNVRRRSSLYQTIERLTRAGLVTPQATVRDARWPERTVYEITDLGRETAATWMAEMISDPAPEYPRFPAALAHLPLLEPGEARAHLERRLATLRARLREMEEQHRTGQEFVPRLFLVESEYMMAMLRTEAAWVASLVDDLRSGALSWDEAWLRETAERFYSDDADR